MGKSAYHRSKNKFRFKTFHEHIAGINIDAVRKLNRTLADPDGSETFFGAAFARWLDLNCTENFVAFSKRITGKHQNLSLLVHHQNDVVGILQEHLENGAALSLEPLLDLIVHLARDLQSDFYQYFYMFFDILVKLLQKHDHNVEALKQIFTCIAYLYKFLWRHLMKDIQTVYTKCSCLLSKDFPAHINTFAAESFSYLLRRSRQPGDMLMFVLNSASVDGKLNHGIGRLLFETVKGVQKSFHSSIDTVLPILLNALGRTNTSDDHYDEIMCVMVGLLGEFSTPDTFKPVWHMIMTSLGHSQEKSTLKKDGPKHARAISSLIKVLKVIQDLGTGHLVIDEKALMDQIFHSVMTKCVSDGDVDCLLEILSKQLKSVSTSLSAHSVIRKFMNSKLAHNHKLKFCHMLSDIKMPEEKVLPAVLEYCSTYHKSHKCADKKFITLVAHILTNSSRESAFHQVSFRQIDVQYQTDTSGYAKFSFPWLILETLRVTDRSMEESWAAMFCLGRLTPLKSEVYTDVILNMYEMLVQSPDKSSADERRAVLWTLYETVRCLQTILKPDEYFQKVEMNTIIQLVTKYPTDLRVLQLANKYFQFAYDSQIFDCLSQNNCQTVLGKIEENVSSPYAQKRWLALNILKQFAGGPVDDNEIDTPDCIFTRCIEAEQTDISLESYRERVRMLSRIEHSGSSEVPCPVDSKRIALRFLIGNLYVNFAPVWKPVCALINSYAEGMAVADFWDVYSDVLHRAAEAVEKLDSMKDHCIEMPDAGDFCLQAILTKHISLQTKQDDRPDYVNFRLLLWTTMNEFASLCERKSKIVAPLLFRYMTNEYYAGDRKLVHASDENITDEAAEEETNQVEHDDKVEKKSAPEKTKRYVVKTLVMHLELFAKFKNPSNVHLAPKLKDLYLKLLQERNENIAKSALKCLTTYKHDYLQPYNENLERLIDSKSFKDEIVLFNIEEDYSPVVKADHRENLMPILMRILHGKMMAKGAKDSSGQYKKDVVMRFLASCKQQEMTVFLDLVFDPLEKHCHAAENVELKVADILDTFDRSESMPLRQQTGALGTIEILMKRLPHLLEDYLPKIFSVLITFSATYTHLLNRRQDLPLSAVHSTKALRQSVMAKISQFFTTFESYPFSSSEINALFASSVWPQIEKLPNEGIYSPTPLMKMLMIWSKNERYFPLLGKKCHAADSLTILPFVFELLTSPKASAGVTSYIMELVGNLVSSPEDIRMADEHATDVSQAIDVGPKVYEENSEVPLSISLLLPHIQAILKHIHTTIAKPSTFSKNSKGPLLELQILSSLSRYAPTGEMCEEIAVLLFAIIGKKFKAESSLYDTVLITLQALLTKVTNVKQFVQAVSKLFSSLTNRGSREQLCKVFEVMAKQDMELEDESKIATKLNSWDRRHVDEPDYLLRLEGFEDSERLMRVETNRRLLVLLVHNCTYIQAKINDMALRDAARQCLENIINLIDKTEESKDLYKEIIVHNLLAQVKQQIGSFDENARNEFLNTLGFLVKTFPESAEFSDLQQLIDQDVEVDFFQNIVHIQVHRRSRALKKFARLILAHKVKRNTVLNYVLPLTNAFTQEDVYTKSPDLADAAVTTIGAAAKTLPWPRYHMLLRYHIRKTSKGFARQKLLIRIVVAILDNFHFDLRHASAANKIVEKPMPGMKEAVEREIMVNGFGGDDDEHEDEDMEINTAPEEADDKDETTDTVSGPAACTPAQAARIEKSVLKEIIPMLYKSLTQKTKSDDEHKKAKAGKFAEDDEILNVPIALAMIKLLQAMPGKCLHQNLPSILMKVCQFLKSRSKEIRVTARQTLMKILEALGVSFISYILRELNSALTRGYQKHVLGYTLHALLEHMTLNPGDLDNSLDLILSVCTEEIFGEVAEEKEVEGILSKVFEARTNKSYFTFGILAKHAQDNALPKIILHVKQTLDGNPSFKKTQKAAEVLKQICAGVVDNTSLQTGPLLVFIYGIVSETFQSMKHTSVTKMKTTDLRPQSTYILHKDIVPSRKKKVDVLPKTSMYVLVEFGLQLLFMMLKRCKLSSSNPEQLQMLDPFVDCLISSLSSKHVKVITSALKCFSCLLKFPLPSLRNRIASITQQLFVLLNNYARGGAAKGDNFHLVVMGFKTVTVLVRDVNYHNINEEQLNVLLTYCELDTKDFTRQATAFTLLRAILSRKLVSPALPDLIKHLETLAVTSETPSVRQSCRQITMQYILDYPLGSKLRNHVEFFISQLEYEYENGRKSALEMVASMVKYFPRNLLGEYAGVFFLPLASQLSNDESPSCRMLCSLAIKELLAKLPNQERDNLFLMCSSWLSSSKVGLKKVAVINMGLFVEVEAASFVRHLPQMLELLQIELDGAAKASSEMTDMEERQQDHLLYSLLNLILKISKICDMVCNPENQAVLNILWETIENYLVYPHVWVQLVAGQLYGMLFQTWTPDVLVDRAGQESSMEHCDYILENFDATFHSLCGKFTKQLSTPGVTSELADQIVRNLVFVAKVLRLLPPIEDRRSGEGRHATFDWLFKRLCREAKSEMANNPKCHTKRMAVMKWFAAISVELGKDKLMEYLPGMLTLVVREYTDQNLQEEEELKVLSKDVMDLWKELVGTDVFTRNYIVANKNISEKRESRKVARAVEAVSNPEINARRTLKKNLAKKEAKKRKSSQVRVSRKAKFAKRSGDGNF